LPAFSAYPEEQVLQMGIANSQPINPGWHIRGSGGIQGAGQIVYR